MAVVSYQLLIILSLILSYLGAVRLRSWLRLDKLTPMRVTALVAVGWTVFTLAYVFTPLLIAVQLLFIWGTFLVLRLVGRQADEIDRMRRALEPRVVERIIEIARSQSLQPVVGRAHARELRRALDGAQQSLVILSGWASDYVIDGDFRRRLGQRARGKA